MTYFGSFKIILCLQDAICWVKISIVLSLNIKNRGEKRSHGDGILKIAWTLKPGTVLKIEPRRKCSR